MPQPSTTRPAPAARLISEASGPPVPLPSVMYVVMPGLLALMVFSASTVFCWSVALLYGVPSMSMSIALRPYALMTFWYAPARADALVQ